MLILPIIHYYLTMMKSRQKNSLLYFSWGMFVPLERTGWNDKIVVIKKTTLQLYFKTFIEKINSVNLIM